MKSFLTILKYTSLAILLVAMIFGYLFFRTWQKNDRPTVLESSWDETQILIGHSSVLNLTIKAPWHRELNNPRPTGSPDFLAPVARLGSVEKGSLDLTGHRTWYLRIPFVATDTKSLDGLTASFPIKNTKRISPTTVNVDLPPLSIILPTDLPDAPQNPEIFLTEDELELITAATNLAPERKPWWPWVLGGILLAILIFYLLRRTGVIKTTPAWEKALGRLDKLPTDTPPAVFFSKLTDILKGYTSDRYSVRARAKTSAEFIRTLQDLPSIPNEYLSELPSFARLADGVKFADQVPAEGAASRSLELVRSFVKATIPVEPKKPSHE